MSTGARVRPGIRVTHEATRGTASGHSDHGRGPVLGSGEKGTSPLMGWLSDFKTGRQIEAARAEMNRARSPFSVAQFVERCIEYKSLETALEEAEKGLKEFPNSEK